MHQTLPLLSAIQFKKVIRNRLATLQVNLGYRCNQACVHCHVAASPKRSEEMSKETIDAVLMFLAKQKIRQLDLTGGAPELNPHFLYLVETAAKSGIHVTDRCNLTILEEPGQEHLADFLASQRVSIIASLPCYLEDNVDKQRGNGVFAASVRGLLRLNGLDAGELLVGKLQLGLHPVELAIEIVRAARPLRHEPAHVRQHAGREPEEDGAYI